MDRSCDEMAVRWKKIREIVHETFRRYAPHAPRPTPNLDCDERSSSPYIKYVDRVLSRLNRSRVISSVVHSGKSWLMSVAATD